MSLFSKPNRRLFLLGALSACGFTPALTKDSYKQLWGKVSLPEAKNSANFTVRRALAAYFGEPTSPEYRLEFEYSSSSSELAVTQSSVVTRYRITATGSFVAYKIGQDAPILKQDYKRIASYSASSNRFASDEAKTTATTKLLESLADEFAIRFVNAVSNSSNAQS